MTKEQVSILLASAEELQKHLDERAETLRTLSQRANKDISLSYEMRAETYTALGLINLTQIGAYQSMFALEAQGFPVFSKAV